MKVLLLAKRWYTGVDLIKERFGRLYRLPMYWSSEGADVEMFVFDLRSPTLEVHVVDGMRIVSIGYFFCYCAQCLCCIFAQPVWKTVRKMIAVIII